VLPGMCQKNFYKILQNLLNWWIFTNFKTRIPNLQDKPCVPVSISFSWLLLSTADVSFPALFVFPDPLTTGSGVCTVNAKHVTDRRTDRPRYINSCHSSR